MEHLHKARWAQPPRLLLVEQDPSLLVCAAAFLLSHGYLVDCAENACEASALLDARASYAIVVTCLEFPLNGRQNGLDVIRRARSVVPKPATVLWTTLDSPGILREAKECGADRCVLKSTLHDLLEALSGFAKPSRAPAFPAEEAGFELS